MWLFGRCAFDLSHFRSFPINLMIDQYTILRAICASDRASSVGPSIKKHYGGFNVTSVVERETYVGMKGPGRISPVSIQAESIKNG